MTRSPAMHLHGPLHATTRNSSESQAKQSIFPDFDDADVRIIVTGSRQYALHSVILKTISPTMRELLTDENAATLSKAAQKRGVKVIHRLILIDDKSEDAPNTDADYHLEPIQLGEDGKPIDSNPVALDLENGRAIPPIVIAYHAVLGAFYNIPIEFGDFEQDSMINILTNAMVIIKVAEYLQCIHLITKPIEATLLSTGQVLHQSIANNPAAWLDFAYRVRSRTIFREALIHATGKSNTSELHEAMEIMQKPIVDVVVRKGKALKEAMRMACLRILCYYPTHMQREKTVGRADKDSIGRASYANDIMSWIALVVLRQWLTQALVNDQTHQSPDLGKEFADKITEGGDKYLSKPEVEPFHDYFPMSPRGISVLEDYLQQFKEHIKQYVKDFQQNESQLDTRRYPVKHFTCTTVNANDYPWDTGFVQMHRRSNDGQQASRIADDEEELTMTDVEDDTTDI